MKILSTPGWTDYELLDSGNCLRLERFGKYIVVRPDPQIIWKPSLDSEIWKNYDFLFNENGWLNKNKNFTKWKMIYKNISFFAKLSPFKHTGIFPEQHLQWDFIDRKIKETSRPVNVLNLFAYTGIASLIAAAAGASVTHVDASSPSITWAKENQSLSSLINKPIRWILDDAIKFVEREIRRGIKYDGIIMDPPVYGHGPSGEKWDFNKSFPILLESCRKVLSDSPIFIIINAYAISSSSIALENMLMDLNLGGVIESGELVIEQKDSNRLLSTGIYARWSK
ncbi:MAG: class I SAM-dependent methyltransferase [Candidatus Levybacteria bacterium]|nr:class I SAM-dependent methyltransferase [Candidatus Levybacteria bacterium]